MNELKIKNLTKKYGNKIIIQNLTCNLDSNSYNFLIGPNGSGKTTMIKCLLGYVSYYGKVVNDNISFSYAPDNIYLPEYINVYNLLMLLMINKKMCIKEADILIENMINKFSINQYKYTPIYKLSKGTKQKVVLIQCLITNSDVYIFDEPLNGLDQNSKKVFIDELKKLKAKNKIIIISTHHLKDYKFRNKKIIQFPIKGENINACIDEIT